MDKFRVPLFIGGVSFLLVLVSLTLLIKSIQTMTPIRFSSDSLSEATGTGRIVQTITIDIEGAVVRPGVYELPTGSRVEDAIAAAGGVSEEVDAERLGREVNRASKLPDGAKLYIPKKGDIFVSDIVRRDFSSYPSSVSVNAASQSELEALSGIGPVTAQKIIAGRPYQTLEELVTKKAVSQSLFTKLRDQLSL